MYPGDNCTNYAAYVESEVYGVSTPDYLLGDGGQWGERAALEGVPVDGTPSAGAVAVVGCGTLPAWRLRTRRGRRGGRRDAAPSRSPRAAWAPATMATTGSGISQGLALLGAVAQQLHPLLGAGVPNTLPQAGLRMPARR